METAYRNWEKRREHVRHASPGRRTKLTLGERERRRLAQLLTCVLLFLVVFIGKGIFPEKLVSVREAITQGLVADTDFRAAFASLGRSISNGEPVLDTLGNLCVEVFGGTRMTAAAPIVKLLPTYEAERTFLSRPVSAKSVLEHRFGIKEETPQPQPVQPTEVVTPPEPAAPVEAVPPAEPAVIHVDYTGPAMPENSTMDKYTLGLEMTVCPVSNWWESSAFGWREHPVDGGEKFHHGLDMAVNDGTDVKAFADGTVDFIGDSPDIYGLYIQISHANGVKTFYAHNSELLVQKGQTIKAGDVIAKSGDTGNVTGPHLHFEIKKDGILLNPLYYVDQG